MDEYPPAGSITTSALAEGAIEGAASDYEVASAYSTGFAFSRFHAEKGGPLSAKGALSSDVDASSVEGTPKDHSDTAQGRRMHEELLQRMDALEARNAALEARNAALEARVAVDAGGPGNTRSMGLWPVDAQRRRLSETTTCCAAIDGCGTPSWGTSLESRVSSLEASGDGDIIFEVAAALSGKIDFSPGNIDFACTQLAGVGTILKRMDIWGTGVSATAFNECVKDIVEIGEQLYLQRVSWDPSDGDVVFASLKRASRIYADVTSPGSSMTSLSFPALETITGSTFQVQRQNLMRSLSMPNLKSLYTVSIKDNAVLEELDFSSLVQMESTASFTNLPSLQNDKVKFSSNFQKGCGATTFSGVGTVSCSGNAGLQAIYDACTGANKCTFPWNSNVRCTASFSVTPACS